MPRKHRRRKYPLITPSTRSDWRFWLAVAHILQGLADEILKRFKDR